MHISYNIQYDLLIVRSIYIYMYNSGDAKIKINGNSTFSMFIYVSPFHLSVLRGKNLLIHSNGRIQ